MTCAPPSWFCHEPWFDTLRGLTDFGIMLTATERRRAEAATAFRLAGGDDVLDVA